MSISEYLISFQNQAEKDFETTKNLSTLIRYILAFILSTLIAFITIPLRLIKKLL